MSQIKIVFFASLREQINCSEMSFELNDQITVVQLKQALSEQLNQPILLTEKIKASVNFEFARDETLIDPNTTNEVAFFPPVTGG